jgi:glyoxylase-like metal-dependent hydrolase (beta-lactamase superfamily II)
MTAVPPPGTANRGAIAIAAPSDTDLWLVAPETWCLRMPVDLPIRYTHCYLVLSGGQTMVVDPGWDVRDGIPRILDALRAVGSAIERVVGVVATHAHRDHVGLAHDLAALAGDSCWVGMHEAELNDHAGADTVASWRAREAAWMDALGVPPTDRDDTRIPLEGVESILRHTRADRALRAGEVLAVGRRRLTVLHTPGHSPGSLCLVDAAQRLVFTGDTLLPRISPNVGWAPHGTPDPLGDYLASLQALRRYRDWTALPGHEWPFTGLDARADHLTAHHGARDNEILGILRDGDTPWSLATRLSWSRSWTELTGFQHRIAAAETAAHLRRLIGRKQVEERPAGRYARREVQKSVDTAIPDQVDLNLI